MRSSFVVSAETEHTPAETWARLWDLDRHTAVIPLTTVTPNPPATRMGAGAGFTGRTALGPLGFDDPMTVTGFDPPQIVLLSCLVSDIRLAVGAVLAGDLLHRFLDRRGPPGSGPQLLR